MDQKTALAALGQETLDNIAQALWLPGFDETQIPPDILEKLVADKNSSAAFGERIKARLPRAGHIPVRSHRVTKLGTKHF